MQATMGRRTYYATMMKLSALPKTVHPVAVRIGTTTKSVTTSAELPLTVANWILDEIRRLPIIPNVVHETDTGFGQAANLKRLRNGFYLNVHGQQTEMVRRGRRLLNASGFSAVPLEVELENGDVLTCDEGMMVRKLREITPASSAPTYQVR